MKRDTYFSERSDSLRIAGVKDMSLRACYLCKAILGQLGVFKSESLNHMLMICCGYASMLELRMRLYGDVKKTLPVGC